MEFRPTNEERKADFRRRRANKYSSSVYSFPSMSDKRPAKYAQPYYTGQ